MSAMHSSNNGGSSSANMRQFGHIARKLLGEVPRTLHRTVCHHHRVDTRERPNDNPERRNWSTLGPAKIPAVECENAFLTSNLHPNSSRLTSDAKATLDEPHGPVKPPSLRWNKKCITRTNVLFDPEQKSANLETHEHLKPAPILRM